MCLSPRSSFKITAASSASVEGLADVLYIGCGSVDWIYLTRWILVLITVSGKVWELLDHLTSYKLLRIVLHGLSD